MKSRPKIVYLSFDGMMEPLGYSQVARVVQGLAGTRAYEMTICSLERARDREDGNREAKLEEALQRRNINWRRGVWSGGGGPLDVARNVRTMGKLLSDEWDARGVDLIHARSYVAASVARRFGGARQVPYLFDIRGFWVDERLEQGRWFTGPVREGAARLWEKSLYGDAAGVVSLTQEAADEIKQHRLSPSSTPVSVIPTCVDYGEFGLGGPGDAEGISEGLAKQLRASLVVGFVGAVEQAYCVEESIRLFDHILARRPDAHLLCLTRNPPALLRLIEAMELPPSSYTVRTAPHEQMPAYLKWMDWGLLLRRTEPSHRAAMPTKLAEFFAGGVRPIQWGCNGEVRRWVEQAGSGHVLERLDEAALRRAADVVATAPRCMRTLLGARWRTRHHFGLQSGVKRYARIYDQILARQAEPRLRVLFLTEGKTVPASRFRVGQLVPHLEERGIACTVRAAYGEGYNRWSATSVGPLYKLACSLQRVPYMWDANRYDVVFLQRPALPFSSAAERAASWRNPSTIFDVDDAIFVGADGSPNPSQKRAFREVVESAAHVICGNQYLAGETSDITPTTVIPTVVDTDRYRPLRKQDRVRKSRHRGNEPLVIGWTGTSTNFVSLQLVAPCLRRLLEERDDIEVHLVANAPFEALADIRGVRQFGWKEEEEIQRLQSFDIGIMPLLDNASTRGKCGFKAIQYMAVGIPVVASRVGANKEILGDSAAGILAEDLEAFDEGLRRLIDDPDARESMGQEGRQRVVQHYSIDAVIERYIELFEAVARQRVLQPHPQSQEVGHRLLTP